MFDPRSLAGEVAQRRSVADGDLLSDLDAVWAQQAELAAREADLLGELDERGVIGNSAATVVRRTGMASHAARVRVAAARNLRALPRWRNALAAGRVSADHVRHVAAVADRSDARTAEVRAAEAKLLAVATNRSADEFRTWLEEWDLARDLEAGTDDSERRRSRASVRRRRGDDRMTVTTAELDPEANQTVWNEIDRLARQHRGDGTSSANRRARALVEMARRSAGADGDAADRARPVAGVMMTLSDLLALGELLGIAAPFGLSDRGAPRLFDGTPITPAEARRMACEADIVPIVLGGDGMPIDVGRRRRLATFEQRMALRAMFDTCIVNGCDVPFDDCEIHHLWPFELGGETDLDGLRPVCPHDHTLVHEGKLALAVTDDGAITYLPPGADRPTWANPSRASALPPDHPLHHLRPGAAGGLGRAA